MAATRNNEMFFLHLNWGMVESATYSQQTIIVKCGVKLPHPMVTVLTLL